MPVKGAFVGLSTDEINTIKAAALQAIVAASVRGISYSIAGRQFSFPNLESCRDILQECNYALGILNGQRSSYVRANFNSALGRGTPQT
jgi:hypothetical protein